MFDWFRPFRGIDAHKIHGHLIDYTDEELKDVLTEIEKKDAAYLATICAEILRRQLCKTDTHK